MTRTLDTYWRRRYACHMTKQEILDRGKIHQAVFNDPAATDQDKHEAHEALHILTVRLLDLEFSLL